MLPFLPLREALGTLCPARAVRGRQVGAQRGGVRGDEDAVRGGDGRLVGGVRQLVARTVAVSSKSRDNTK